jgi:hypothetical protein
MPSSESRLVELLQGQVYWSFARATVRPIIDAVDFSKFRMSQFGRNSIWSSTAYLIEDPLWNYPVGLFSQLIEEQF